VASTTGITTPSTRPTLALSCGECGAPFTDDDAPAIARHLVAAHQYEPREAAILVCELLTQWSTVPLSRYAGAGSCPGCGGSSVSIYFNRARGAHFFGTHIPGGELHGARCPWSGRQCSFTDLRSSTIRGAWDSQR
jgi:hypothetical protein